MYIQSKFDLEKVKELYSLSDEEILEIIDDLIEWMDDPNWPVAVPIADFLYEKLYLWKDKLHAILDGTSKIKVYVASVLFLIFYCHMTKELMKEFEKELAELERSEYEELREYVQDLREKEAEL